MNATRRTGNVSEKKLVDTAALQEMLSCGRKTAVEIGMAAQARTVIGRRVLWYVGRIEKYLDTISE